MIYVNGLYRTQRLTGVQRYAHEIVTRLGDLTDMEVLEPTGPWRKDRISKHAWEQLVLPLEVRGENVLWSPTNTGPVRARQHILTVHDGAVLAHPEWFSKAYVAWRSFLLPRLLKNAKRVITVSQFSKKHLLEHIDIPAEKIVVIPGGVNHHLFRKVEAQDQARVRTTYQLDAPFFLGLSSLEPRKNFSRLIRAWEACETDLGEAVLAIVGSPGASFADPRLESRSKRIRFLGYVPDEDLPALYSAATAFVYPSLFEGFGLPVLEAMACSTPVLTSDTTALPEIAQGAALMIDPFDPGAIADGLTALYRDAALRADLSRKGLARAGAFDWERAAEQIARELSRP